MLPYSNLNNNDFLIELHKSPLKYNLDKAIKLNLNPDEVNRKCFADYDAMDPDEFHYNFVFNESFGYCDNDEMNKIFNNDGSETFSSLLHLNARSLIANQDMLFAKFTYT